jgi:hypothetical protein
VIEVNGSGCDRGAGIVPLLSASQTYLTSFKSIYKKIIIGG